MDTKKKILLVEDDEALANVYRSRLDIEGFETEWVSNGEEALAAATRFRPDLILLDAMMPKISGFDVLDILLDGFDLRALFGGEGAAGIDDGVGEGAGFLGLRTTLFEQFFQTLHVCPLW